MPMKKMELKYSLILNQEETALLCQRQEKSSTAQFRFFFITSSYILHCCINIQETWEWLLWSWYHYIIYVLWLLYFHILYVIIISSLHYHLWPGRWVHHNPNWWHPRRNESWNRGFWVFWPGTKLWGLADQYRESISENQCRVISGSPGLWCNNEGTAFSHPSQICSRLWTIFDG